MAKKARHPYVSIRCPQTSQLFFVKEARDGKRWGWLYRGQYFDTLDEVVETRLKKLSGKDRKKVKLHVR